jgi:hypothetical protein
VVSRIALAAVALVALAFLEDLLDVVAGRTPSYRRPSEYQNEA